MKVNRKICTWNLTAYATMLNSITGNGVLGEAAIDPWPLRVKGPIIVLVSPN